MTTARTPPTPIILVTREVRWFHSGPIPASVLEWFTDSGRLGVHERRTDRYDLASARDGIGVKQRSSESVDMKRSVSQEAGIELAPGLVGCVEDWVKVSRLLDDATATTDERCVSITKDITTRRYILDEATIERGVEIGCEVELADINSGGRRAWTLCFETIGPAHTRQSALLAGIEGLLEETPLPDDLSFTTEESCGYPAWIAEFEVID